VLLTPQFLRALHGRGTLRVPDIGREASRPCNRNHRFGDFLRDHQFWSTAMKGEINGSWEDYA
jgi:hypothetical protein